MPLSIQYQGYTITAPEGPSEQGEYTSSPTPVQVVTQIDQQFVYNEPPTLQTVMGETPANELIWGTLTMQCYWVAIYNNLAQQSQISDSVQVTSGVTTTDSDTETFGMSLGLTAPALPGISAALTASFSKAETHSVALSEGKSETRTYVVLPGTTLQVWQLHTDYITEYDKDGKTYRSVLSDAGSGGGLVLALTFPDSAQ